MELHITAEDINEGCVAQAYICPVAIAVKRAGFHHACVGLDTIMAWKDGVTYKGRISTKLSNFICRFDETGKAQPASFNIDLKKVG